MRIKPINPAKTFFASQKKALFFLTKLLTEHQNVLGKDDLQALSNVFENVNKRRYKK